MLFVEKGKLSFKSLSRIHHVPTQKLLVAHNSRRGIRSNFSLHNLCKRASVLGFPRRVVWRRFLDGSQLKNRRSWPFQHCWPKHAKTVFPGQEFQQIRYPRVYSPLSPKDWFVWFGGWKNVKKNLLWSHLQSRCNGWLSFHLDEEIFHLPDVFLVRPTSKIWGCCRFGRRLQNSSKRNCFLVPSTLIWTWSRLKYFELTWYEFIYYCKQHLVLRVKPSDCFSVSFRGGNFSDSGRAGDRWSTTPGSGSGHSPQEGTCVCSSSYLACSVKMFGFFPTVCCFLLDSYDYDVRPQHASAIRL